MSLRRERILGGDGAPRDLAVPGGSRDRLRKRRGRAGFRTPRAPGQPTTSSHPRQCPRRGGPIPTSADCYAPPPRSGRTGIHRRGVMWEDRAIAAGRSDVTAAQLALELPLELPRSRSRPSGRTSSACGATRSTRCARTSRASRRRSPTRSSPATRGPATSCSTRSGAVAPPRSRPVAEGRIGVGNDLNPFAHLLTAAKVDPATRAEARDAARHSSGSRWLADGAAWTALGERVVARSGHPGARMPAAGSGAGPMAGDEAVPAGGRALVPSPDAGPAALGPERAPPRRPRGSLPGRRHDRHPPRQERARTSPR